MIDGTAVMIRLSWVPQPIGIRGMAVLCHDVAALAGLTPARGNVLEFKAEEVAGRSGIPSLTHDMLAAASRLAELEA